MLEKLDKVKELLEEYYIDDILIEEDEIISIIVNSIDDKFLSFYLPGLFDLFVMGLQIKYIEGFYTVIENKKRMFSKIVAGDKLIFINNIPILSFLRESSQKDFLEIKAIRNSSNNISLIEETVVLPFITDGSSEILCEEIHRENIKLMYVKFTLFSEELNEIFIKYGNKNINLIIDIRDHTGGNMNCMINCLNLFLKDGDTPFSLLSKGNIVKPFKSNKCSNLKFNHIFIIINENTSSSAEIFCASLKDCLSCTIMGKRSYGKNIINKNINKNIKIDPINNLVIPTYRVLFDEKTFIDGVVPDIVFKDKITKNKIIQEIDLFLINNI